MSPKILALDTSTENCSVALMMGDQWYCRSEIAPRDHTKKILPMVDAVLKEANLSLQDLDALAFGRGPGSFTGVRIGIGIAQGLAFGADLPMIGISTLKAMAQGAYRHHGVHFVASAIDARMSEVYWGRYQRKEKGNWLDVDQERVIAPAQLVEQLTQLEPVDAIQQTQLWHGVGTGWSAYEQELQALPFTCSVCDVLYPDAQDIAFLAQYELEKGNTVPVEQSAPIYLRDNVTWKKLPGRE